MRRANAYFFIDLGDKKECLYIYLSFLIHASKIHAKGLHRLHRTWGGFSPPPLRGRRDYRVDAAGGDDVLFRRGDPG